MSAPDLIAPHIGYRYWRPVARRMLGSLRSANTWPAREPQRAGCLVLAQARPANHDRPPVPECTCGCYAFTLEHMDRFGIELATFEPVVGRLALWGRVIEADWGYRAEFATPIDLAVVAPMLTRCVAGRRRGVLRRRREPNRIEPDPVAARELADGLARSYGLPVSIIALSEVSEFVTSPLPELPGWIYSGAPQPV